jgi:hypothetical protein
MMTPTRGGGDAFFGMIGHSSQSRHFRGSWQGRHVPTARMRVQAMPRILLKKSVLCANSVNRFNPIADVVAIAITKRRQRIGNFVVDMIDLFLLRDVGHNESDLSCGKSIPNRSPPLTVVRSHEL